MQDRAEPALSHTSSETIHIQFPGMFLNKMNKVNCFKGHLIEAHKLRLHDQPNTTHFTPSKPFYYCWTRLIMKPFVCYIHSDRCPRDPDINRGSGPRLLLRSGTNVKYKNA